MKRLILIPVMASLTSCGMIAVALPETIEVVEEGVKLYGEYEEFEQYENSKKQDIMLEKLLSFFKGSEFGQVSNALSYIAPLLKDLDNNYTKDNKDAKNALIDSIIAILQAHKDQP